MTEENTATDNAEQETKRPAPSQMPHFIAEEGKRQAEAGGRFYGKLFTDMTRDELYGGFVMGWHRAEQLSSENAELRRRLAQYEQVQKGDAK